ncbi:MAG: hypothetical protein WA858_09610 [Xanthobacteraceae bacterium]
MTGGVTFTYTNYTTNSTVLNVNKKTSSVITDPAPVEDAVDHNFDMIWLFLHPKYDVTINGGEISWALDPDQSAGVVLYVYAGGLKNPSQIQSGVLQDLQAAGITPDDYQVILSADPLAQCLQPGNKLGPQQARVPPPLPIPPVPCLTPAPTSPRYVPTNMNIPYDEANGPGQPAALQTYSLDNSTVQMTTNSVESDYAVGVTASDLPLLDALTIQATFTVQDINTKQTQTGTEQKASLTMGGPAYGYTGPANMDVYYDALYMTFAFVPNELSPDALHGAVSSSQGKPVVAQLVIATAAGVTYRTYTNAKGEYHFSKQFSGPIDVQTGVNRPPPAWA